MRDATQASLGLGLVDCVKAPNESVLLTTRQMIEVERKAIASGVTGYSLMQRAGVAVVDACAEFGLDGRSAAVLCGPGNNGGDGFVVARLLAEKGWSVVAYLLDAGAAWPPDASRARADWTGETLPADRFDAGRFTLIVDALFGAGLSRGLSGPAAKLVTAANASGRPIVAADIPSGIDGNSGAMSGVTIDADVTVTFGSAKPGHYLYPGKTRRGRLVIDGIGLDVQSLDPETHVNNPVGWLATFPWPSPDGHKYQRGHAVVVSGSMSQTGAARMAARAALRIGAGLVTLASPRDALLVNATHLTAVMLRASDDAEQLADLLSDARKNAVVMGPGLGVGPETRALVGAALSPQSNRREETPARGCLLDADALTSFAGDAPALTALIAKAPGSVVITPHDGEFARLFANEPAVRGGSKLDRARAAARRLGCVVLLKGADTVVADCEGRATIADGGTPWLATAGSGDVLAGMIGGLLAQGMPAFAAACAGTYLHEQAARSFGPGLIAEDLPECIPAALQDLLALTTA